MSRPLFPHLSLFFCLLTAVAILFGCSRKEETSWSTHAVFPVAYGSFGLETLVPDSLVQADEDGVLHLVIEENLTDFDLDSLVKIPDTVVVESFVVDLGFVTSFDFDPGTSVPLPSEDFLLETELAELREIITKSGAINYEVFNYINGPLAVNFSLPGVTQDGESFSINDIIPGGTGTAPSIISGSLDLAGYHFDLTGGTGSGYNVLESSLTIQVDPDASGPVTVFNQDSVAISISFVDPVVSYARGYFGQHVYTISDPIDFAGLGGMSASALDIDAIDFSLEIENYVGMDAQIQINKLEAINLTNLQSLELDHQQIGESINITRAQDNGGSVTPTFASFSMDETTSNIDEFIEVVPEKFNLDVDVSINPLGDISGGNDFIYTDQALNAILKADIPLCFSVDNLQISDTLDIALEETLDAHGQVLIYLTNNLPIGATMSLSIIDHGGAELAQIISDGMVSSGIIDGEDTIAQESLITVQLGRDQMRLLSPENRLFVALEFNSYGSDQVKFSADDLIEVKIVADVEGVIGYN